MHPQWSQKWTYSPKRTYYYIIVQKQTWFQKRTCCSPRNRPSPTKTDRLRKQGLGAKTDLVAKTDLIPKTGLLSKTDLLPKTYLGRENGPTPENGPTSLNGPTPQQEIYSNSNMSRPSTTVLVLRVGSDGYAREVRKAYSRSISCKMLSFGAAHKTRVVLAASLFGARNRLIRHGLYYRYKSGEHISRAI